MGVVQIANHLSEDSQARPISIQEAMERIGVSRRTIYNWLKSGKIKYIRTAGGSVRIFPESLWRDNASS